ncbi:S1 family peptidase [Pseudomonas putida]|uniref:S1 family peptidase n=1 Tax=Pseudomonas putida TaxID=303 RepID=UPI000EF75407|nr:serine protease [Pseudomonas putida]AYN09543.1 hypothetical protein CHN49_06700 [Pseudomonas putida]
MKNVRIDTVTVSALYVEPKLVNDQGEQFVLSNATAFTVKYKGFWYLVTNWHVVTGKNPDTDLAIDTKTCALPNFLSVHFRAAPNVLNRVVIDFPLVVDEEPVWVEHRSGKDVDVVVIPIPEFDGVHLESLDLASRKTDIDLSPGLPVSIIGFPFGLWNGPAFAIWKTGAIASDVEVDYRDGRKAFLVDASTRMGMSGSPVLMRSFNGYLTSTRQYVMGGVTDKFLGVYSGRLNESSDVGIVWRAEVLVEMLDRIERQGDKFRLLD